MTDTCYTCNSTFAIADLLADSTRKKGYRNKCRGCYAAYVKSRYVRKTKKYDELADDRKKRFLDETRNVPCLDCGGRFPSCAMDFDHLGDKSFNIMSSYRNQSLERLQIEIAKCEIVCANCHRIRTAARRMVQSSDV